MMLIPDNGTSVKRTLVLRAFFLSRADHLVQTDHLESLVRRRE
jgi:hypothetical protein